MAYEFYVRAYELYEEAFLTRCYTQHAFWPYIDSEINRISHFIKTKYCHQPAGHISFIYTGSKFRFPSSIDFYKCHKEIVVALQMFFVIKVVLLSMLNPMFKILGNDIILNIIDSRISFYSNNLDPKFNFRNLMKGVHEF